MRCLLSAQGLGLWSPRLRPDPGLGRFGLLGGRERTGAGARQTCVAMRTEQGEDGPSVVTARGSRDEKTALSLGRGGWFLFPSFRDVGE